MAFGDFGKLGCFYNGSFLEKIISIHHTGKSGIIRVDTLNEGLSGFTPGSGDATITVNFVMPVGGTEEDFYGDMKNERIVTLQVPMGGKAYIGNGKIETVEIGQSVNASVEGTFNWLGELSELQ